MQSTLANWLAVVHMPGIGPRTVMSWLTIFNTLEDVFRATPKEREAAGLSARQRQLLMQPDWALVEKALKWAEQPHCHIVSREDGAYPELLREAPDAPLVLFVQGDVIALNKPQIAMVGARHATPGGSKNAEQFAFTLAEAGLVVTSGLALGVDAASHRGALRAQGQTIAVMGTGLAHVYPASHRGLAAEIVEKQGALVSEFPLQAGPLAGHFPRRNRIISGLSLGVLVVEAAIKSGSLGTVKHALEQGREVFAIPGSIHHPLARGCHHLIRQGAKLVETAQDILEELRFGKVPAVERSTVKLPIELPLLARQVLAQVGEEVTSMDRIILQSGLTSGEVSSILLSLELGGYIQAVTGGYTNSVFN